MAKKQTRRSISVSRTTYERLKAFCETNHISMSQLVETRVNDFLGGDVPSTTSIAPVAAPVVSAAPAASMVRPQMARPAPAAPASKPLEMRPQSHAVAAIPSPASVPAAAAATSAPSHAPSHVPSHPGALATGGVAPQPMTSAAARFAVDPPPPIIKPRQDTVAPKPAEKRPDQIFTF